MKWLVQTQKQILKTVPFTVESLELIDKETRKPLSHPFHRLTCPDWINILPITKKGEVVLVKQNRAGSLSMTLEIPGGMVDDGEAAECAAIRELEEETGYRSQQIVFLGSINPNPAIMSNTLHMYLAKNCDLPESRQHFPDENEDIEIVLVPLKDLLPMVKQRKIDSALACLTIMIASEFLS